MPSVPSDRTVKLRYDTDQGETTCPKKKCLLIRQHMGILERPGLPKSDSYKRKT